MIITLKRYKLVAEPVEAIDGQLYIDGHKVCDTAENPNGALPVGSYPVTLIKCHQYDRKMMCLNPEAPCGRCPRMEFVCHNTTLPCYCPMLKPGNGVHNRLDGSIIVGEKVVHGFLIHPKTTFDAIYERVRKAIQRGHSVELLISDSL